MITVRILSCATVYLASASENYLFIRQQSLLIQLEKFASFYKIFLSNVYEFEPHLSQEKRKVDWNY